MISQVFRQVCAAWIACVWVGVSVASGEEPQPQRQASAKPAEASAADATAPITVVTRLSPDPSNIGDLLALEVVVAYPDGYTVNLPTGLEFSPLERVDVKEGEPESTGTGWRRLFTVSLQYFSTGDATIASFPITYVDSTGGVHTVDVPPRKFSVASLLANEADPQPKADDPPISISYPNKVAETAIYAGIAALLLGLGLARVWSRWRRRVRPVFTAPPVPPHTAAYAALDHLEGRRTLLLEEGQASDYYVELTEITKAYVQSRFGIDALDRTTDEIRSTLIRAGSRLAPLEPTELMRFLEEGDLVKFARFAPGGDVAAAALEKARSMVRRTTASPVSESGTADVPGSSSDATAAVGAGPPSSDSPSSDSPRQEVV